MSKQGFEGIGAALRALRATRHISQLDLALQAGVSQRHLSYVETGRAQPSRELLLALLQVLSAPLATQNELLMLAGYAPMYAERPLASADMAPMREALKHLLKAHEPSPAVVLDASWNLIDSNRGAQRLLQLLLGDAAVAALMSAPTPLNMLQMFFAPDGMRRHILNFDECAHALLHHAQQAMLDHPQLAQVLDAIKPWVPRDLGRHGTRHAATLAAPVLHTHLQSPQGELRLFSMFTTFGTPQDITAASLRVEHMFAADEATARVVQSWL
jgi:transcriptional regulator with XRE-family HTH domain